MRSPLRLQGRPWPYGVVINEVVIRNAWKSIPFQSDISECFPLARKAKPAHYMSSVRPAVRQSQKVERFALPRLLDIQRKALKACR
jgi:hypothetical protein